MRKRALQKFVLVASLAGLARLASAQVAPTVAFMSPVPGETICGTTTISATASSPVGIAGVQFKYDGHDIMPEATAAPYTVRAYTHYVPNGSYTLTAVARDTQGNVATSAPVPVTVSNGSAYAPCRFIPTFLVYYGGGPALKYADAWTLGQFDLLDLDRNRYCEHALDPANCPFDPNTWAVIRPYNSDIGIYLYEAGAEATNYNDGTRAYDLFDLGRYDNARGHSMGSLDGNQPELFLLDGGGSRIYNVPYSIPGTNQYSYLMDFGSATYQSYWLEAVNADIVTQPWVADGVFADLCTTNNDFSPYSGIPVSYPTNAEWIDGMNRFVGAISAGMHGSGQRLWCNRGATATQDGSAAWLALDASANPPDAVMEEGAFAVQWGPWATQFYAEAAWKHQLDTMAAIQHSKVTLLSHTQLAPGGSGTDNWGKPVTFWQTLWYSMGSFLLAKNDVLNNDYFMFHGADAPNYNAIVRYAEYDMIDLGKALGPYAVANIGGTNVYGREFEYGYVYVNPTPDDVSTITLPQPCRQRTHENLY
ncbi:MAG: putative glycoside hydrolase, partial [Gemmatimonadales bacterium]